MRNKNIYIELIPVMFSFFVMGFVDLVGIATNYVKADFELSDTVANIFPSMVFFWFLIFSVPTGMLMNKIGRRKTVLLSLIFTACALILPWIDYTFSTMLISFSLLGIGNAIMQVSLNPLLSNIVNSDKLASSVTFGQFVKAIASFLAPLIAGWAALKLGDWLYLFPVFLIIAIIAVVMLAVTPIQEKDMEGKSSTFKECFALLKNKLILLSFIGIMCHVGVDVGFNLTAPKLLIERLGIDLAGAGIATSVYFLFRTIGSLAGAFILAQWKQKTFFLISTCTMIIAVAGLFIFKSLIPIYICTALIGLGNSNVFSILFSQAILHLPNKKNEVSGLMIMGLFGGTVFPLMMGIASDAMNSQTGALIILCAGIFYLFLLSLRKE
ncbi:MAG: MFS transporter [Bacteroidales bacterium]|nr:MFS transporter [Bacteroidales bacterium]